MALRNCDVCAARYGIGDPRNWHNPENWPSECMGHYRRRGEANGKSPYAMGDMEPYKNVYGEMVGGRKQHRDFLKSRGLVEVGNENVPQKYQDTPPVAPDIARAMNELGYRS